MNYQELDEWPPRRNYPPPLGIEKWQRELNRVAGFAPNGMPHLRFEWGCITTWTPYVKELKYLQRRDEVQTGWGVHVFGPDSRIIRTLRFGLKADIPQPSETYGIAFAIMEQIEIGIPRWWISQYTPPSLIGPWEEPRQKVLEEHGSKADMGSFPGEGMYYLGFHGLWHHEGRKCCELAKKQNGRKCFGYFRMPTELDILYVSSLWQSMERDVKDYDWTESADDRTMYRILKQLNDRHEKENKADREAMKARIRDTFKTHRGRLTARKGRDTFLIHKPDNF